MQLIDRFSAHQRYRHLAANTIRRRRDCLHMFEQFIAPLTLEQARQSDVEEFLAARTAARTKHAYRSDLRVFYAWLADKGVIEASPAAKVPSIRVPKSLPRPLAPDDALAALSYGDRKVRRMVALAFFAGLRCHEIAQLQAEDVWLHVPAPVIVVRHGKGAKDRTVPLHPQLIELLRDLPTSGPVFPSSTRPTMHPYSVSRRIRTHLAELGIDGTAHQLRHSFGTELARVTNGNLVMVATFMGHESTNTTMGYVRLAAIGGAEAVGAMYGDAA